MADMRTRNAWLGAAAGGAAGIVASWGMVQFNHAIGGDPHDRGPHRHRRRGARPNDTDGTISDEPASMTAASRLAEAATGRPLSDRGKTLGGSLLHYLFGAVAGAAYGAAAEYRRGVTSFAGVPFGAGLWLAADEVGLPLLGLAHNPADYPPSRHLPALGSHVVFGTITEGGRRLLRGR